MKTLTEFIETISKLYPHVYMDTIKGLATHSEENLAVDMLCENLHEAEVKLPKDLFRNLKHLIVVSGLPLQWLDGLQPASRNFLEPGYPLPPVDSPFGALLDADDEEWADADQVRKAAIALLEAGCRYFVCFGERSEEVHDRIDDCIVEKSVLLGQADYEGVITTYHNDESVVDVAEFFVNCALPDVRGALVLARDKHKWSAALNDVTKDG